MSADRPPDMKQRWAVNNPREEQRTRYVIWDQKDNCYLDDKGGPIGWTKDLWQAMVFDPMAASDIDHMDRILVACRNLKPECCVLPLTERRTVVFPRKRKST